MEEPSSSPTPLLTPFSMGNFNLSHRSFECPEPTARSFDIWPLVKVEILQFHCSTTSYLVLLSKNNRGWFLDWRSQWYFRHCT
ncbi:conserved hypothetical protein [Ricinus communis]|uniref:Uncharacterized protein n=1 Tax=Ricinus communis TaxID=3988 RepID=B9R8P8_RICCO|nr:conserved hypothetical protein [Ricinus communis]